MHWFRRLRFPLALVVVGAAGLATAFAATVSGAPSSPAAAARTVTVKGTDSSVRISPKTFAKGTHTFRITNNGRRNHTFVVAGKRTKVTPHHTKSARITFRTAGKFTWTWTGGPRTITGKLTVTGGGGGGGGGTTSVATTTVATTTTTATTTTATTTTGGGGGAACTNPTQTVQVGMFEYRFDIAPNPVPAGCISFVITNRGTEPHNFDISGIKAGAILAPGQSETWSVQLTARAYVVVCDVPFHIDRGMTGQLTVT